MRVIRECSKVAEIALPNRHYMVDGVLKEIDVHATYYTAVPDRERHNQVTRTNLVIECKKAHSSSWVFFSSRNTEEMYGPIGVKYKSTFDDYLKKSARTAYDERLIFKYPICSKNHHFDHIAPQCISYDEVFGETKGKNKKKEPSIFEAIQSVTLYIQFLMQRWDKFRPHSFDATTDIYCPVVVLDGQMFEARLGPDDDVELIRQHHIQLMVEREEINAKFYDSTCWIDFITEDYLPEFLRRIRTEHDDTVDAIENLPFPKSYWDEVSIRFGNTQFKESSVIDMLNVRENMQLKILFDAFASAKTTDERDTYINQFAYLRDLFGFDRFYGNPAIIKWTYSILDEYVRRDMPHEFIGRPFFEHLEAMIIHNCNLRDYSVLEDKILRDSLAKIVRAHNAPQYSRENSIRCLIRLSSSLGEPSIFLPVMDLARDEELTDNEFNVLKMPDAFKNYVFLVYSRGDVPKLVLDFILSPPTTTPHVRMRIHNLKKLLNRL
ncbi:MAG: hypothetical protein KKE24_04555 [Candidatus Thermoplasmatota archaeon]|nr:hypothetical protein [Candidatus Thermoplasmatota archaeon]